MENYSVYGELRFDVSKDLEAEGREEVIEKAYEFLNDSSNIVSIILVDKDGNEIKFNALDKDNKLHRMDIDWEDTFRDYE